MAHRTTHPAHHPPLQALIDTYNTTRPHRSLQHRATPATTYLARPKTGPTALDLDGKLSLRPNGRMHHIGIGAQHAGTQVLTLVDGFHVRIINAATGELLRELTLDPARNYQPLGRPPGPKPKTRKPDPNLASGLSGIS